MTANKDSPRQIQVLVVDDSAFMRTALSRMITSDSGLWVAGTIELLLALRPRVRPWWQGREFRRRWKPLV